MIRLPALDDAALHRRVIGSMFGFWRILTAAKSARAFERPGLLAAIVPATPERSVFNSVIYDDAEALAAARDELDEIYTDAGVRAWTVWVPETDAVSARMLDEAGHRLDAAPRAMAMELGAVAEPDLSELEWSGRADLVELAAINDVAYDHSPGTFAAGLKGVPRDRLYVYGARRDGKQVAGLATADVGDDCAIFFVATLPDARGSGLATALMRRALWEAQERGCTSTTLQSTKAGRPVYERVGYRDLGALQMWEKRR